MPPPDVFPLLELPPEIWSRICEYSVTYDDPIIVSDAFRSRPFRPVTTESLKLTSKKKRKLRYQNQSTASGRLTAKDCCSLQSPA